MSLSNRTLDSSTLLNNHLCRICGVPAKYRYYNLIVCRPCKIFFRRNANSSKKPFTCNSNGQCEININNHHICTACRLAKCFRYGMNMNKFRSLTNNHQVDIQIKNNQNSYNTYNESKFLSIGEHLMKPYGGDKVYQSLVQEFLACAYETTGIYLCLNDDIRNLSYNDRSIVLRNATDNVSCMACEFIISHCYLMNDVEFSDSIRTLYGQSPVDLHRWAIKFVDSDIIFVKSAFSLITFSENINLYSCINSKDLINPLIIFEIQNKYAEIIWKYILYRHGLYRSVQKFLKLISWSEAITVLLSNVQTVTPHINDINALV